MRIIIEKSNDDEIIIRRSNDIILVLNEALILLKYMTTQLEVRHIVTELIDEIVSIVISQSDI